MVLWFIFTLSANMTPVLLHETPPCSNKQKTKQKNYHVCWLVHQENESLQGVWNTVQNGTYVNPQIQMVDLF